MGRWAGSGPLIQGAARVLVVRLGLPAAPGDHGALGLGHEPPRPGVAVLAEVVVLAERDVVTDRVPLVRTPRREGPILGEHALEPAQVGQRALGAQGGRVEVELVVADFDVLVFQRQSE